MNQRQKKKISQSKKKYHDSKAKAEKQQSTHQQKQDTQKPRPTETVGKQDTTANDKAKDEKETPSASALPEAYDNHDRKSYSRRKIVSNWDRYTGNDSDVTGLESEEELQKRLLQLLNLPTSTAADTQYTEWEELSSGTEEQTKDSFLKLDCVALAASFSSLPLHKRLDLNPELWELDKDSSVADAMNPEVLTAASNSRSDQQSLLSRMLPSSQKSQTIDLSCCKLKTLSKPFDFNLSTQQSNSLSKLVSKDHQLATDIPSLEQNIPPSCEKVLVNSANDIGSGVERLQEERDETLDLLLASEQSNIATTTTPTFTSEKPPQVSALNTSTTLTSATQELDDMLDDLLA